MYEEHMQVKDTDENHCRICEYLVKYCIRLKRAKYLCNLENYGASTYLYDRVMEYVKETARDEGKSFTELSTQRIARLLQQQADAYDGWKKYDKALEALQKAKVLLEELDPERYIPHEDNATLKKDIATVNRRIAAMRKKVTASQS
ncbi:MAG: hypothetical protein AAF900_00665 [Bacteroidota bacterium]